MPIENLFTTRIGSHIWKMNHPGSDVDLFRVRMVSTKELLKGTADTTSRHKQFTSQSGIDIDCHVHEVGIMINQLLKGNINFVIGVMSPWIEETDYPEVLSDLRQLTEKNVGKSIYHSVKGMAVSNYKKYIVAEKDSSPKKCNTILRTLEFAIRYLDTGKFKFEPVEEGTPATVLEGLYRLDRAYESSSLLSVPNETRFREWLLNVRMCMQRYENGRTL